MSMPFSRYQRTTSQSPPDRYGRLKAKLTTAFKALRQDGLVAKQNFLCCQSCANSQMHDDIVAAGLPPTFVGIVYYHSQDNDDLKKHGHCHLTYGPLHADSGVVLGKPAQEVGLLIFRRLVEAGLDPEWNGSPDTRIKVKL